MLHGKTGIDAFIHKSIVSRHVKLVLSRSNEQNCSLLHGPRHAFQPSPQFFHCFLYSAVLVAAVHSRPCCFSSWVTNLLQFSCGLPVFLLPSGVHLRGVLCLLVGGILRTWPIMYHLLLFTLYFCGKVNFKSLHMSNYFFKSPCSV